VAHGLFCVSASGGAVIDKVTFSGTGKNPVKVENCHHVSPVSPDPPPGV
jgi:hypothetical protein